MAFASRALVGVLVASCGGGSGAVRDEASDVARLEVVVDFNFGNGGLAVDAPMAARQLAIERSGNVLLADGYEVRRVDLRTGRITNIPGTHLTTCADGSTAERLCETGIMAVAADRVGRVYFAVVDGRIFRVPPEGGAPEHVAGLSRDQCPSGHLPIAGPVDQVCFALITDLAFDRGTGCWSRMAATAASPTSSQGRRSSPGSASPPVSRRANTSSL
jgi:hypothetical protein